MKSIIGFNQKLRSEDKREYWITSDLHFYHKNIFNFCSETRPYDSLEEMHEALIADWNSKVKPEDVIFHLGDFSFAGKEKTQAIIDRLQGNIVWIRGNHDYKVFGQLDIPTYDYLEIRYDGKKVCMMHYSLLAWNGQGRGSVMLHGHSHGGLKGNYGKIQDVGWDSVGEIITLKKAIELADSKEIFCPDHHKIV